MDLIYLKDVDAYISILGHGGETYGISVYEGEYGLNDFKILASQRELNLSSEFAMYLQNNLTFYLGDRNELSKKQLDIIKELGYKFRGHNAWLYFMSFKRGYIPFNFDNDEVMRMKKYLSALHEALYEFNLQKPPTNFQNNNMLCYSSNGKVFSNIPIALCDIGIHAIDLSDDLNLVNELKRLPRNSCKIELDVLPLNISIDDKEFDRPQSPTMCMVVDSKSGMVLNANLSNPNATAFINMTNTFVDTLFKYGLPKKVSVSNSFSMMILDDICNVLKIKLDYVSHLPAIDKAFESFGRFM